MSAKARIDLEARDKASHVFEKVQRSMGDMDKRAAALSKGFAGLGDALGLVGIAGSAVVTAIAGSVVATANFADGMGKAAQRAGVLTEEFSKLAYAATLSDVQVEQLQKALQLIGQDAATGGKRLSDLGISLTNLDGSLKTSDQLFHAVADRISGMETPAQRTAAAIALLGEEGGKLVPMLNVGSQGLRKAADEAGRFGQVVTDEAVAAAEQFNDNMTRLRANVTGIAREMGSELIPVFARLSDELLEGQRIAGGFLQALVTFGTINPFRSDENNLRVLREELAEIEASLAKPRPWWRVSNAAMEADRDRLRKQIEFLEGMQRRLLPPDPAAPRAPEPVVAALAPARARPSAARAAAISKAEKYTQTLRRQLEAMDELTVKEQLLRDIGAGRLGKMTQAQREELTALAQAIDARRELADQEAERLAILETVRQAAIDEANAVHAASQAREAMLQSLLADTSVEKTKLLVQQMWLLDDALIAGRINADQHAEAVKRITESTGEIKDVEDAVKDLNLSFSSSFERAIEAGEGLRGVLNGIISDVARLAFRRAVTEPLGNALNSVIGRIFSFDGGGFTGSGSRSGGMDGRGGFLAMLHPQETVIDHTKGRGAAQTMVYSPQFIFNGPADQALVMTAAHLGASMGRQAVYDDMARGRV